MRSRTISLIAILTLAACGDADSDSASPEPDQGVPEEQPIVLPGGAPRPDTDDTVATPDASEVDGEPAEDSHTIDGWEIFRGGDLTPLPAAQALNIETFAPTFSSMFLTTSGTLLGNWHSSRWRSTDRGRNWSNLGTDLGPLQYLGTDRQGAFLALSKEELLRSDDDGMSWVGLGGHEEMGRLRGGFVRDDDTIFLFDGRNIVRSDDGGTTFSVVATEVPDDSIGLVDRNDTIHLLERDNDSPVGIHWRKHPHDERWYPTTPPDGISRGIVLPDGAILLATENGLHRSADYGDSWAEVEDAPAHLVSFVTGPSGRIFASDLAGIISASGDGGVTWARLGPEGLEPLEAGTIFAPLDSGRVLVTRGSKFYLSPEVETEIGAGQTSPAVLSDSCYNGAQDTEEVAVDCGGPCRACPRWEPLLDTAGSPHFVSSGDDLFRTRDGLGLEVSSDRGRTWTTLGHDLFILAERDSLLYATNRNVDDPTLVSSADGGRSWETFGTPTLPGVPLGMVFSSSPGLIYLSVGGAIYRSSDEGLTWESFSETGHRSIRRLTELPGGELVGTVLPTTTGGPWIYKFSSDGQAARTSHRGTPTALARHEGTLYAYSLFGGMVYSEDAGDTWTQAPGIDGTIWDVAVTSRGSLLYVLEDQPEGIYSWRIGDAGPTKHSGRWVGSGAIFLFSDEQLVSRRYLGPSAANW